MKAFTLLELLVTILIFSVVIAAIYAVLNVATAFAPIDMGLLDLQQQTRQATEWIARETRESKASDAVPTTISTDVDSLTFKTPDQPSGIQYSLSGNQLIRTYNGATRIIAQNITRLKFTKDTSTLIIEVGAAKTVLNKPLTSTLKEKVRFRN